MRAYSTIVEKTYGVFLHCATYRLFLSKCTPFPFLDVFGLKKRFASLKFPFWHDETFLRRNISKKLFLIGGEVVFESYAYSFEYFLAL